MKIEVKVMRFLVFQFFFRYVKGGVLGNNNIGIKKCTTTFLWVLNLGQVGEIFKNFQKHPRGPTSKNSVGEHFFKNSLQGGIFANS